MFTYWLHAVLSAAGLLATGLAEDAGPAVSAIDPGLGPEARLLGSLTGQRTLLAAFRVHACGAPAPNGAPSAWAAWSNHTQRALSTASSAARRGDAVASGRTGGSWAVPWVRGHEALHLGLCLLERCAGARGAHRCGLGRLGALRLRLRLAGALFTRAGWAAALAAPLLNDALALCWDSDERRVVYEHLVGMHAAFAFGGCSHGLGDCV
jgi:hypothetical protein